MYVFFCGGGGGCIFETTARNAQNLKFLIVVSCYAERIRNLTMRQQIGLEETIIKEIEQNQLTWYGHVQRMAEESLPKIALRWMLKQKRA
jgi:hypothetical protein